MVVEVDSVLIVVDTDSFVDPVKPLGILWIHVGRAEPVYVPGKFLIMASVRVTDQ